ncbi:RNA polymerase sigma factor [Chitinimonas lacunae]|uniref:RNA polymerase sigma factor n=1 Tax=Chitinimonas lacunae TaxID=1963018 RepID=A0ABV8MU69_9NEIS
MDASASPGRRLARSSPAANEADDQALMLAYAAGDAAAFDTLYQRHRRGLYGFLARQSPRPAWIDDLFQETWLAVIRARADYRPSAQFRTWLFGIARNKLIDRIRLHEPALLADLVESEAEEDPLSRLADPGGRSPETRLADRQAAAAIAAALQALPPVQREVFLLREQAEMSLDEIARLTGVSPETAKSRLRYAVSKLKTALMAWSRSDA